MEPRSSTQRQAYFVDRSVPQLEFFAAREDQVELLRFLFTQTDVRVVEHSSRPDSDLLEFKSVDEVATAFNLGDDPHGNGLSCTLALWSPSVIRKLEIRRIDFDPNKVANARFRYEPAGGALMQLYLGGLNGLTITKSHFGHNSQVRARNWGIDKGADWQALGVLSRRIQYHIRSRLAVARVPGRPILAHAGRLWREGYALKESAKAPYHWTASGLEHDG
jgi:hypothetical protein